MANYKFDGTYFNSKNGQRIAKVSGDYLEDYQKASKRIAKISGEYVEDYTNASRRVAKLNGEYIEDYANASKRICKIDDLKKIVEGYPSKMQLLAFWWFFAR